MSTLKKVEVLWEEYCKACDIKVTDDIEVQLNPCEPRFKVSIHREDKCIHFTVEEVKALAWALDGI